MIKQLFASTTSLGHIINTKTFNCFLNDTKFWVTTIFKVFSAVILYKIWTRFRFLNVLLISLGLGTYQFSECLRQELSLFLIALFFVNCVPMIKLTFVLACLLLACVPNTLQLQLSQEQTNADIGKTSRDILIGLLCVSMHQQRHLALHIEITKWTNCILFICTHLTGGCSTWFLQLCYDWWYA